MPEKTLESLVPASSCCASAPSEKPTRRFLPALAARVEGLLMPKKESTPPQTFSKKPVTLVFTSSTVDDSPPVRPSQMSPAIVVNQSFTPEKTPVILSHTLVVNHSAMPAVSKKDVIPSHALFTKSEMVVPMFTSVSLVVRLVQSLEK